MAIPRPGQPVRGSHSGAPVMAAFDLLGRRWAMGIIWNLSKGPATFRMLQEQCETISPSILNSRTKDLREAGLVRLTDKGFELTPLGDELYALLRPVADWSIQWAEHLSLEERENQSDQVSAKVGDPG
ncbi:helix-turn-helix domain-containing protein [uncultured Cohaesibacter sp.]|uniref:winged helix-turn-helix transcriptional regulator n=1 Tax=uncultured Cohaesibacter sp. TaxID=1002546 RepID=UPI0029C74AFF|nr:helix-turn-helix domain-containing protein [uncultured Cohaesibacter sp.]